MTNQNHPAPLVLFLNVEELLDGAWAADHSLLPALSSKGESPFPNVEDFDVYREAYEDYVRRFTETAKRLADARTPGQEVQVDAGDNLLRGWHKEPLSSFGDPLFDATLKQTQLPTIEDIMGR